VQAVEDSGVALQIVLLCGWDSERLQVSLSSIQEHIGEINLTHRLADASNIL
jgi:hypothetical protein